MFFFFFSSRRRHTRLQGDWSSDVCSSDLMNKMGSHTSRYASLCALWYEKTGDDNFKEKAFRSFNWATYMAHEDGLITEAMAEDDFWYSDGYADYIRHFMAGGGAVLGGGPPPENHILRASSLLQKGRYVLSGGRYMTPFSLVGEM